MYGCILRLLQSGVELVLKKIGHEQSGGQIVKSQEISPGESLPPCRGLWGTLHTGDNIDCNYCLLWEC